jgi:hypothetical protein
MTTAPSASSLQVDIPASLQRLIHDVQSFQLPAILATQSEFTQLEAKEKELLATLNQIDVELDNFLLDSADAGIDANERAAWKQMTETAQSQVHQLKRESQQALVKARRDWKAQARNALWSDMAESREERERRRQSNAADQR